MIESLLLEYHSLDMDFVEKDGPASFLFAPANRQELHVFYSTGWIHRLENKDTQRYESVKKDRFMRTLNNKNRIDRANSAAENISTGENPMRNSSTKAPWHLRFAPGDILRKVGFIAVFAVSLLAFVDPTAPLNAANSEFHYYIDNDVEKQCDPPMDGKITATPTIKAGRGTIRRKSTVNGYVDSSWPDMDDPTADRSDQGYVWTEYFKIHWDEVVHNPDHDPDDPCSVYLITNPDNLDNEGLHEHGDEYISAGEMQRRHMGARQGKKTDCEGIEQVVWSRTGEWVFSGESEKVKSVHWLHSEIADDPDMRLAKDQNYDVAVYWKLDYLTYNGYEFEVVETDLLWNRWFKTFSAHSPERKKIDILTRKNTEVNEGPDVKGGSQLFWTKKKDWRKAFDEGFLMGYIWNRGQSKKTTDR